MCRVFMATKHAVLLYNKQHGLLNLFQHLEKECGGQGNGLALIKDQEVSFVRKGVKYSAQSAVDTLLSKRYDFALWHTRVASVSSISDANCHPFTTRKGDAMIMNGTVSGLSGVGRALGMTDTELVFDMLKGSPASTVVEALSSMSPVFCGAAHGVPYVVRNHGDLSSWGSAKFRKGDFMYASSFPAGIMGEIPLPDRFTWLDGEDITPLPAIQPLSISSLSSYHYGNSWYDRDDYTYTFRPDVASRDLSLDDGDMTEYEEGYADGYAAGYADAAANGGTY